MCFPITGYLTASAKDRTELARAICSRNDGTTPDCKGALRNRGESRGKRSLNEKENGRRVELNRGEETRAHEEDNQLMQTRRLLYKLKPNTYIM